MIDGNYFLLNVFLLAVGTITIRGFFIALSHRMKVSTQMRELFTFIPAAILPGFILPATFFHEGTIAALAGKERFFVLIVSGIVFFFFRNTLFIIMTGLLLLYALKHY